MDELNFLKELKKYIHTVYYGADRGFISPSATESTRSFNPPPPSEIFTFIRSDLEKTQKEGTQMQKMVATIQLEKMGDIRDYSVSQLLHSLEETYKKFRSSKASNEK